MKLNDDKNKTLNKLPEFHERHLQKKCERKLFFVGKTCGITVLRVETRTMGRPLTCGRGRKQPSPGGPPALAVAVAVAAVGVGGVAFVVVSVQGRLVGVMSVFRTRGQDGV